jgi:hypothetical protein
VCWKYCPVKGQELLRVLEGMQQKSWPHVVEGVMALLQISGLELQLKLACAPHPPTKETTQEYCFQHPPSFHTISISFLSKNHKEVTTLQKMSLLQVSSTIINMNEYSAH